MASRAPRVITHGTAGDAAALPGYSASGASEHSRNTAHASDFRIRPKGRWREPGVVSAIYEQQIAELGAKLAKETDAVRAAKLERNLGIKSRLLANLKSGGVRA